MGDSISNPDLARSFNTRNNITDIPGTNLITRRHRKLQYSNLIGIILLTGCNKFDMISFTDHPVYDFEVSNNATEGIKHRVKNQALQRSFRITFRSRHFFDNCI